MIIKGNEKITVPANTSMKVVCLPESDSKVVITLEQGASIEYRELAEKPVKSDVEIIHKGRDSTSRAIIGAIVSSGKYSSRTIIRIMDKAENSDVKLEQRALVIGDAIVEQKPELDINNRNVKAGHAASVERPGKEMLFYLKSRSMKNPEKLIVDAFRNRILGEAAYSD